MLGTRATKVLLLYLSHLTPKVVADCYSHDGVRATDSKYYNGPELLSCGRGSNNCCMRGERCGSNLLCYNPSNPGYIARQYCADPDWNGCSTLAPEFGAAGVVLKDCRNNTVTLGSSCETGQILFIDPADGVVYNSSSKSSTASPTFWSIDSVAILASATASGSPTSSAISPATFTPTSGLNSGPASNSSPTATAPPAQSSSESSSSSLSAGAGAGIGIGAAAAVAIAAVAVWFCIRRRRRQSASQDPTHMSLVPENGEASYRYTDEHKTLYAHKAHETVAQPPRQELGGHTRSELP